MNGRNRGYTILELIIVIAILSIMTMIAIPRLNRMIADYRFKTDIVELKYDLLTMRNKALNEGKRYRVNFYPGTESYTLNSTGAVVTNLKTKKLSNGIDMLGTNFPDNQIFFTPTGSPSKGGSIFFKDKSGKRADMVIILATGKVYIKIY